MYTQVHTRRRSILHLANSSMHHARCATNRPGSTYLFRACMHPVLERVPIRPSGRPLAVHYALCTRLRLRPAAANTIMPRPHPAAAPPARPSHATSAAVFHRTPLCGLQLTPAPPTQPTVPRRQDRQWSCGCGFAANPPPPQQQHRRRCCDPRGPPPCRRPRWPRLAASCPVRRCSASPAPPAEASSHRARLA